MAGRIRTIKPELLEDEKTAGLSHEAFRLFVGVITLADDYGNFRCAPARLHGAVFWATSDAEAVSVTKKAMDELVRVGLVWRYAAGGQTYAHLSGWSKHQRVDKPGPARCPKHTDTCAIREPFANESLTPREPLVTDPDPERDHEGKGPRESEHGFAESDAASHGDDVEGPVPDHDPPVTDEEPEPGKPKRPKADPSPDAIAAACHLLEAIRSHTPDHLSQADKAEKAIRSWSVDLDKAIRLDGVLPEGLKRAADYAHRTPDRVFWRANILSGKALREKFAALRIEARERRTDGGGARASPDPNRGHAKPPTDRSVYAAAHAYSEPKEKTPT